MTDDLTEKVARIISGAPLPTAFCREKARAAIAAVREHDSGVSVADKIAVKAIFRQRDGETVYPDEIADSLGWSVSHAARVCKALVEDGKVAAVREHDASRTRPLTPLVREWSKGDSGGGNG